MHEHQMNEQHYRRLHEEQKQLHAANTEVFDGKKKNYDFFQNFFSPCMVISNLSRSSILKLDFNWYSYSLFKTLKRLL